MTEVNSNMTEIDEQASGDVGDSWGKPNVVSSHKVACMPVERKAVYYNMNHRRRGMAIILNHEHFDIVSLKQRTGTNVDCENLKETLEGLGFEVTVHTNKKVKEVMTIINEGVITIEKYSFGRLIAPIISCILLTMGVIRCPKEYSLNCDNTCTIYCNSYHNYGTCETFLLLADDLAEKQITRNKRGLQATANKDHSDCDCFVMAVLSHGEMGILYSKDSPYKPDSLWSPFTADKCPSLAGKPKLFFLQACQGDKLDAGITLRRTETDSGGGMAYKIPVHADFLIAYSTVPGFYSWRNTTNGSWFMQALCCELQEKGFSTDILTLLTFVIQRVALDFESNTPGNYLMHQQKQIPCVTTMLTRLLQFTRK